MIHLRPGSGTSLRNSTAGHVLSYGAAKGQSHPWKTTPAWSPVAGRWIATVAPGFVNSACPIFRTTVTDQVAVDKDFGVNPLTGERYFSAHVFSRPTAEVRTYTVDIPLYLAPAIPMQWRPVGWDGPPGSIPPEFFRARGAEPAPAPADPAAPATDPVPSPRTLRLLRACDIILHQPRPALTSSISVEDGLGTGVSLVTQTLGLRFAPQSDRLRLLTGAFSADGPSLNPVAGDYEEPTWDEILVATVYALSPTRTPPGSEPDASWTPFVRHNLFWNLCHHTPPFRASPLVPGLNAGIAPILAGGAAQLIVNYLTATLNDLAAQSINLLTAHSMAGAFWTPTGGGHDPTFPDAEAALASGFRPETGLDKAGRLQARRTALADARNALRLDPVFPYRALPFDPAILS